MYIHEFIKTLLLLVLSLPIFGILSFHPHSEIDPPLPLSSILTHVSPLALTKEKQLYDIQVLLLLKITSKSRIHNNNKRKF